MPTLLEELQNVQPCDGRSLLQLLNQRIIQEVLRLKRVSCEEVANTLAGYGLEGFYPCDYLNEEFLEKLIDSEPLEAISSVLVKSGYPPNLLKIFIKGLGQLEDKELQETVQWLSPIAGIQIHPNTARYLRTDRPGVFGTPLQELAPQETTEVNNYYLEQGIASITEPLLGILRTQVTNLIKCPSPEVSQKLITRVQNLARIVTELKNRLTTFQTIVNVTSAIFNAISRIVDILKRVIAAANPAIAAAALTPFTAGIAALLNKIVSTADRLITRYEPRIEALDKSTCAASKSITFVVANVTTVDTFIRVIDELLRKCIQELADSDNPFSQSIASALTPISNQPSSTGEIRYRGYRIEVRVKESSNTLKQRFAVGIDLNEVVAIQGPLSYSADTEILIEELKHRIDTYLG
jgi:hypothetical protein